MLKKLLLVVVLFEFVACNDMHDVSREPILNDSVATTRLLVLSEGLFNMNNSTLAMVDMASGEVDYDFFRSANKRGLGDTGNDMQLYGSKVYVVVNVSSQMEVIDPQTGVSIRQIPFFNEDGVARQPRCVVFRGGKAYVSCFDGYVARVDTASLEIDGWVRCGRNPDCMAIAGNKLYVSNSGGLDNPFYDNSVSVVDLTSFSEIKQIGVGLNPGSIVADSEGDIYVISRGDYDESDYLLHKIDGEIDTVVNTFNDIHPLKLTMFDDMMYMYSYDFTTKERWIKIFDCLTDRIVNDCFITDGTEVQTPFALTVDNVNGDVYIADAYNYVLWGDVMCFGRDGKLKFRINEIGLNPNSILPFHF